MLSNQITPFRQIDSRDQFIEESAPKIVIQDI